MGKGTSSITTCMQLLSKCIVEPIESHQIIQGLMATSTSRDLHPGTRRVGMMLRNLSTWEMNIPPKAMISNVQTAQIVPNMKTLTHTSEALPSTEQKEPSQVGLPTCLTPNRKELTHSTPMSLQLEPGDPTLQHDILEKVDLSGCTKWDPMINKK